MYPRDTVTTPAKSTINSNKTKIFKPIILFHTEPSSCSSQKSIYNDKISLADEERINKHRIKVKKMLKANINIWESIWSYSRYDFDSISSGRVESTSCFSQKKYDKTPDNLQNSLAPCNFNLLDDESNETFNHPIENKNLLSQLGSPIQPYLTQGPQHAITQSNYAIGESKKQHAEKIISNSLLFKTDLRYPQHSSQNESEISTNFIPETLEALNYNPLNKKRKRENIPKEITEYLKQWLIQHKKHPYPTEFEKKELAEETGLMVNQISNWFINARRRILQPMLKNESRKIKIIQDKIIYSNYPLFDQSLNDDIKSNDSPNYIYTHRRFYHTNEKDNSNIGEPSSSSTPISTIPTTLRYMGIARKDEEMSEQ